MAITRRNVGKKVAPPPATPVTVKKIEDVTPPPKPRPPREKPYTDMDLGEKIVFNRAKGHQDPSLTNQLLWEILLELKKR